DRRHEARHARRPAVVGQPLDQGSDSIRLAGQQSLVGKSCLGKRGLGRGVAESREEFKPSCADNPMAPEAEQPGDLVEVTSSEGPHLLAKLAVTHGSSE
ncbi:MAG: hypothetical protein JKY65_19695, partial [Planctomycetes bacterium]|nr:hypothetical protein [Planctomycetota bacterium]